MSAELEEYGGGALWFSMDDGVVIVGATIAGIQSLGVINHIEFAEVGDEFRKGDWIAEINGSEGALQVVAPEDLTVEEFNTELVTEPSFLEDDPTGDGWLLRGKRASKI